MIKPPVWMHLDCGMLTGPISHHLILARELADDATRGHIDAALKLVRDEHHRRP